MSSLYSAPTDHANPEHHTIANAIDRLNSSYLTGSDPAALTDAERVVLFYRTLQVLTRPNLFQFFEKGSSMRQFNTNSPPIDYKTFIRDDWFAWVIEAARAGVPGPLWVLMHIPLDPDPQKERPVFVPSDDHTKLEAQEIRKRHIQLSEVSEVPNLVTAFIDLHNKAVAASIVGNELSRRFKVIDAAYKQLKETKDHDLLGRTILALKLVTFVPKGDIFVNALGPERLDAYAALDLILAKDKGAGIAYHDFAKHITWIDVDLATIDVDPQTLENSTDNKEDALRLYIRALLWFRDLDFDPLPTEALEAEADKLRQENFEIKRNQSKFQDLSAKNDALRANIEAETRALQEITKKASQRNQALEKTKLRREELETEIDQFTEAHAESEANYNRLQTAIQKRANRLDELKTTIADAEAALAATRQKHDELSKSIQAPKTGTSADASRQANLDAEISAREKELADLNQKLSAGRFTLDYLRAQGSATQDYLSDVNYNLLRAEAQDEQLKRPRLTDAAVDDETLKQRLEEVKRLLLQSNQLKDDIQIDTAELERLRTEKQKYDESTTSELDDLKKSLVVSGAEALAEANTKLEATRAQQITANAELAEVQAKIQAQKAQSDTTSAANTKLEEALKQLKAQKETIDNAVSAASTEYNRIQAEVKDLTQSRDDLQDTKNELDADTEKLRASLKLKKAELEALETKIPKAKESIVANLGSYYNTEKEKLDQVLSEYQTETLNALDEETDHRKKENEELEAAAEAAEKKLTDLKQQAAALQAELQELEEAKSNLTATFTDLAAANAANESLTKQVNDLKTTNSTQQVTITELNTQVQKVEEDSEQIKDANAILTEANKSLEANKAELESKLADAQAQQAESENELLEANKKLADLENAEFNAASSAFQLAFAQTELDLVNEEIAAAKKSKAIIDNRVAAAKTNLANFENESRVVFDKINADINDADQFRNELYLEIASLEAAAAAIDRPVPEGYQSALNNLLAQPALAGLTYNDVVNNACLYATVSKVANSATPAVIGDDSLQFKGDRLVATFGEDSFPILPRVS